MSNRCGRNPVILLGVEGTYGTQQKTPTVKSGCTFNFNNIVSPVEVPRKTGQITAQVMESVQGNKYTDGTLEGTLTKSMLEILLRAMTGTTTGTPWVHVNSCLREGLTIYQYYHDPAVVIGTTNGDKFNVVSGCIVSQLTLSAAPNDTVKFSATVKGRPARRDLTNVSTEILVFTGLPDTDPSHPNDYIAKWGDITATLGAGAAISKFNGFSLTLTNELCGDEYLFQNSDEIQNPLIATAGGSLTASWIFDDTKDPTVYANLQGTLQADTIVILFGIVNQFTIVTNGIIEGYETPDPGNCLVVGNMTKMLKGDIISTNMLSVAYLDLTPE